MATVLALLIHLFYFIINTNSPARTNNKLELLGNFFRIALFSGCWLQLYLNILLKRII